jgi:hypothetical protein
MKSFREYLQEQQAVNIPADQHWTGPQQAGYSPKPWKAQKSQVMEHWKTLRPGMPFGQVRAIPRDHKGPTYGFDGMRLTGSPQFIDSILSRLKDLLNLEGQETRLAVIYRQQVNNKTEQPVPDSFVFYLQIKDRRASGPEAPKLEAPKKAPEIKPV